MNKFQMNMLQMFIIIIVKHSEKKNQNRIWKGEKEIKQQNNWVSLSKHSGKREEKMKWNMEWRSLKLDNWYFWKKYILKIIINYLKIENYRFLYYVPYTNSSTIQFTWMWREEKCGSLNQQKNHLFH